MSDGILITMQMLDDLVERTEATPADLSPEIKKGDWVRMDLPGIMDFYQSGHVIRSVIPETGRFDLAYGDRLAPSERWILAQRYYRVQDVSIIEHWRKIDRVVREPNSITVESVWVQIVHQEVTNGLDTPA